jgi:hypothetical protein
MALQLNPQAFEQGLLVLAHPQPAQGYMNIVTRKKIPFTKMKINSYLHVYQPYGLSWQLLTMVQ